METKFVMIDKDGNVEELEFMTAEEFLEKFKDEYGIPEAADDAE